MITNASRRHDTLTLTAAAAVAAVVGWLAGRVATGSERDQLRWAARHDPLTGLYNRAGWQQRARPAVARALHAGRPVAVGVIDLDHLKAINDAWGHTVGDTVLRCLGHRLDTLIRAPGLVARIGGDEFAFVLIGLPCPAKDWLAESARHLHAQLCQPVHAAGDARSLSVSVGISAIRDGDDLDDCLARADAAMYSVKHTATGIAICQYPESVEDSVMRPGASWPQL